MFDHQVIDAIASIANSKRLKGEAQTVSNLEIKNYIRENGNFCTQSEVRSVMDAIETEENLPVLQRVPYRIWDVSQYMDKYFPSEDNSDEDAVEEGYLLWTEGVNPTFVSIDEYETVGKARYAYALQHGCNYNDVRRKTVKNSL